MKKFLVASLLLIPLVLAGCSNDGPTTTSSSIEEGSSSIAASSEQEEEVDFTIITESEYGYLALPQESYDFAMLKENDSYPPAAEVVIACDWNYVTALNENYTKIFIESEEVVPATAVSYRTTNNLTGTGGTNEIQTIVLTFERGLIKEGTTRIRFETRPGNGVSTGKTLAVCFEVNVYPYGGIEVETYDVDLKVDVSMLTDLVPEIAGATALSFTVSDTEQEYGYMADGSLSQELPLEGPFTSIEFNDIKWAVGHPYKAWLFVENEEFSERRWYPIEAESPSSDYKITVNDAGDSTVVVTASCTIEAVLAEGN